MVEYMEPGIVAGTAVAGTAVALILSLVALLIFVGWNILIGVMVYKKALANPKKVGVLTLFFFIAPFGVIIAIFKASGALSKERERLYASLTRSPDNSNVDALISFIDQYGCTDTPNAWHQLRGVWYACNKSSNITYDKKEELQTYLLLKGLYLNNEERRIINNYGK